jgi:hypothetical protein
MKKQEKVSNGPGRPQYEIKWPRSKFTFTDLMIANEVDPKTGKGNLCSKLTLVKGLKRELKGNSSLIIKLKDVFAPPNSKNGLGRKQLVYSRRSMVRNPNNTKNEEVTTDVSQDTKDYEAQKAALLAPSSEIVMAPEVVVITPEPIPAPEPIPTALTDQIVPVVTITPPAPEVTPEVTLASPAAVAEVAPASELAAVAAPVYETVNS